MIYTVYTFNQPHFAILHETKFVNIAQSAIFSRKNVAQREQKFALSFSKVLRSETLLLIFKMFKSF